MPTDVPSRCVHEKRITFQHTRYNVSLGVYVQGTRLELGLTLRACAKCLWAIESVRFVAAS